MPYKKIYLEPAGRMHSAYKELILYPPEGYEFVTGQGLWDKATRGLVNNELIYTSRMFIGKFVPVHLFKAYLERLKKIPKDIDLTFSGGHLIFRSEPWVVELEWVTQLTWFTMKYLERYRRLIESVLASDYCKKIICWTDLTKKTVLWNLDCLEFEHKLETVYRTVRSKEFVKSYSDNKIKLLFVGSANLPGEFEDEKGGKEALETFTLLNKKYDNLELVIRSDMPRNTKEKYGQMGNLRIIDKIIPWEELEQEFKTADIFLLPAHHTPSMAFLDAMSYELPVVTIDSWANSEIVDDGKTGFVIKQPDGFQLPITDFLPEGKATPVKKGTRAVNPKVVQGLVEKTSILIENEDLRERMGKAGRWEVEHGRFFIERRNEKLKRIFDEATE